MTDGLFDLPSDDHQADHSPAASDRQVQQIRDAFEAHGPTSQAERRAFVRSIANRPVASLRDLTPGEARRIIDIQRSREDRVETPTAGSDAGSTSAWDQREHDTWIDKL